MELSFGHGIWATGRLSGMLLREACVEVTLA